MRCCAWVSSTMSNGFSSKYPSKDRSPSSLQRCLRRYDALPVKYLTDPVQVTVKMKTATAESIRQRFWPVSGMHKLDALTRILEAETFDAMLIFVRTRILTVDLAEKTVS